MAVRVRARDGQNERRDVLRCVEVIVVVAVVVVIDQLLLLCGELLPRYRLVDTGRGSLGVILLTTAPDHTEGRGCCKGEKEDAMRKEAATLSCMIW